MAHKFNSICAKIENELLQNSYYQMSWYFTVVIMASQLSFCWLLGLRSEG